MNPETILEDILIELRDLRAWKEQAMAIMPDMQEIGRELDLTIGTDIGPEILPAIRKLKVDDALTRKALIETLEQRDQAVKAYHDMRRQYKEALGNTWQPIETAPKDGTRILLLCKENGGTKLVEGSWRSFSLSGEFPHWMPWIGSNRSHSTEYLFPTHWMLKPVPPTL